MSERVSWRLTDLAARGRVHLVGVGGAGMSAIAALLAARGLEVSGSDARDSATLDTLRVAGVTVHVGHDAAHVERAGAVVVSTAIRPTNPELARARELGLPVLHRSVALAALMDERRAVAVAGAHGKTTTSAMVAVALTHAGLDPSYAIGGTVLGTVSDGSDGSDGSHGLTVPGGGTVSGGPGLGGAHDGRGDVFVAEADESDGSFLAYVPHIAVVTNIEPDHLDHYGSREAFEDAFARFVERIPADGWLVACADDDGSARLAVAARAAGVQVRTYGTSPEADVVVGPWQAARDGSTGGATTVREAGGGEVPLGLSVPGAHNALNAAAAWTVARLLGVDARVAADGLGTFAGTGRRFEDRGSAAGVRVVDDYAHHPTEVAALLRAARQVARGGRVLVLFQPHLYSRTAAFATEFGAALGLADVVVVTDVYGAREDPDPAVTAALITDAVPDGPEVHFVPDRTTAARTVGGAARPGDLVLTVGAGDVTELAPVVLAAVPPAVGTAP